MESGEPGLKNGISEEKRGGKGMMGALYGAADGSGEEGRDKGAKWRGARDPRHLLDPSAVLF